jgi:DeoR family transcriptional regulator, aga operon transcriptional repressor
LKRSHGGAVKAGPVHDFPIRMKEVIHHAEKVRIAQYAAGLIQPGHTIVLDSGSTTAEIARQLKLNRPGPLTVITNSLDNAFELAEVSSVNLIMIGGILRHISRSFVGPQAEQIIRELHADHLFLGVDAIDPEIGPSTPDILEAQLNGLMIRAAKQVSVVADSSKFGRVSLSVIAPVQKVNRVITDTGIDAAMADSFRRQNIEVITV